jgi:hypothetical protein
MAYFLLKNMITPNITTATIAIIVQFIVTPGIAALVAVVCVPCDPVGDPKTTVLNGNIGWLDPPPEAWPGFAAWVDTIVGVIVEYCGLVNPLTSATVEAYAL